MVDGNPIPPPAQPMSAEGTRREPSFSRRRASIWNLLLSLLQMMVMLLRSIAIVPLYVRYIGLSEWGGWVASGGVLMALTNLDFGLLGAITQQTAVAAGDRDQLRLARMIGTGLMVAGVICCGALIFVVACVPLMHFPDASPDEARRLVICFVLAGAANSVVLFGFVTGGILQSLQRPIAPGVVEVAGEIAALIFTAVFVIQGWGLYAIAWGIVIRSALITVGNTLALVYVMHYELSLHMVIHRKSAKHLFRISSLQFITNLGGRLQFNIDPYLLGRLVGRESAAIYSLTTRAAEAVRTIASQIPGSLIPSLGHLFGAGNHAQFRELNKLLFRLQAITAAIGMGGVIAFNESFMRIWLKDKFVYAGHWITILVAVWWGARIVAGVAYDILYTVGDFVPLCKAVWIEAALRLPLISLLLYYGYVWGIPLGSIIAQAIAVHWILTRFAMRRIEVGGAAARKLHVHLLVDACPSLALAFAWLALVPAPLSWLSFALQAMVFCIVALAGTWLVDRALFSAVLRGVRGGAIGAVP